ncbi:MAG: rhodanese-like domain-containing protein, partial [Pirellulaceae bacterium]|nr:rhodanese-like domain-containing protein [Pirellulaceae bacterium]
QAPTDLIDVRTPVEFRSVHAAIARNVPLDSLDPDQVMGQRNGSAEQPLYLICKSGSRSAKACQRFIQAGYANVVSIQGGTSAWDQAGLPVNRGKESVSLERQVRIAAGTIIFVCSMLALFGVPPVSTIAAGLAAACGAGLVFAGITDSCLMGMLLAKMPWNQVKSDAGCCSAG